MKITIFGSGYVGAITGIGLAKLGHKVEIVDIDKSKISQWNNGTPPIYEIGLLEYLNEYKTSGSISFTTRSSQESKFYFIAVGTPTIEGGNSANLDFVYSALDNIIKVSSKDSIIITKSTVPVGTNKKMQEYVNEVSAGKNLKIVSNPEFLREGNAFSDFFNPDRIVLGSDSLETSKEVSKLYKTLELSSNLTKPIQYLFTDFQSAELIKHASNGFLAIKLSYINDLARYCSLVGADVSDLSKGMGFDPRIGDRFLLPGPGWGGSCFPKDSKELLFSANKVDTDLPVLCAAIESNKAHKVWCGQQISKIAIEKSILKIGILGIAFKAGTDDSRESSAYDLIDILSVNKFELSLHDPKAFDFSNTDLKITNSFNDLMDILDTVEGIVINTEWTEYYNLDWGKILNKDNIKFVIDLRNITPRLEHQNLYRIGYNI